MQPTTWHTGDRVRVFAPGSALHAQLAVVERCLGDTTAAELDLTPGHLTLLDTSALRPPILTMGTAARALLAAWHATGGTGRERDLRKLSDNVLGTDRVRRYASTIGTVQLELTTPVVTGSAVGAARIGEGFRYRRVAELARRGQAIGDPIPPFKQALTEALQQRAISAPARRRWIDRCPSTATGSGDACALQDGHGGWHRNATGDVEWQGELTAAGTTEDGTCGLWGSWASGGQAYQGVCIDVAGHPGTCTLQGITPLHPEYRGGDNADDRLRALLAKAGAEIR